MSDEGGSDEGRSNRAVQVQFPWKEEATRKLLASPLLHPRFSGCFLTKLFHRDPVSEQTEFLRYLIDHDLDYIFIKDRQETYTIANRSVTDLYSVSEEQLRGKGDGDFNPNVEQVAQYSADDKQVLDSKQDLLISAEQITDAFGQTRTVRTIKVPILNAEGQATHLLGIATDITLEHELSRPRPLLSGEKRGAPAIISGNSEGRRPGTWPAIPTILVVDDDDDVSEVTRELLEGAGYFVLVAEDGLAGLSQFLRHQAVVKLVILDVAMPKADGEEMLRQLRKVSPELPVIVCSGYSESTALKRMAPEQFFAKPYDPKQLLTSVQNLLRQ